MLVLRAWMAAVVVDGLVWPRRATAPPRTRISLKRADADAESVGEAAVESSPIPTLVDNLHPARRPRQRRARARRACSPRLSLSNCA